MIRSRLPALVTVAFASLTACGGAQPPIGGPDAMPRSSSQSPLGFQREPGFSPKKLALSGKKKTGEELIYVSSFESSSVFVYDYSVAARRQTLTGFNEPAGECSNGKDVWITNFGGSEIFEYAAGGSSPLATLGDPGFRPLGCSYDPVTGNLAVSNYATTSSQNGNIVL